MIRALIDSLQFEKIVVVPAGDPYQKAISTTASARLAMLSLALEEIQVSDKVLVSDCELKRSGPSYAIDTVHELMKQIPADSYTWVIGSDAFSGIESWHQAAELARAVDFLVIERPSSPRLSVGEQLKSNLKYREISIDALEISSTLVRAVANSNGDLENLVPVSVARYIKENHLYGAA